MSKVLQLLSDRILQPILMSLEETRERFPIDKPDGRVYLVECQGYHKIGQTTRSVEERIKGFSTITLPFNFVPVYSVPCFDRYNAESRIHTSLKKFRVCGEWFRLDPICVLMAKILMQKYADQESEELASHLFGQLLSPEFWNTIKDESQPDLYHFEAAVAEFVQTVSKPDNLLIFHNLVQDRIAAPAWGLQ